MKSKETGKLWSGVMFIILGFIFLINEFFPEIDMEDWWPLLLVITGIIIIYDAQKQNGLSNYEDVDKSDDQDTNSKDKF